MSDVPPPTTTADDRILGLDRRTIGPALLVLALAVWMGIGLPALDNSTSYQHPVRRGDVAELADGITVVPTPGWNLASGALVGHTRSPVGDTAQTDLVTGGVDFNVQAAPFAGSPSALLTRINRINADLEHARGRAAMTTGRYQVTTRQGVVGVAEDFTGVTKQGSVVAFVFKSRPTSRTQGGPTREGVEILVSGPNAQIARQRDHVVAMIRSIRTAS